MTLPRKFSSFVARSRRVLNLNNSGVVSISVVVAWPAAEFLVVDDVFQERNVGLHAANAEFAQRAVHALQSPCRRSCALAITFTSSES